MKNIFRNFDLLTIVYFFIGTILGLVPIFFASTLLAPFIVPKTFLFLFLVEVTFFFYVWLAISNPIYRPKKNYILYALLAFVLLSVLSGMLGKDPSFSFWSDSKRFDGMLVLIHLFLFFLIIIFTVRSKKILNRLLFTSVISSVILSLSMYLVQMNVFAYLFFNGGGGLMNNDSYAGVYLLFNIFFLLYLILNTENRYKRYIFEIFLAIILFSPGFFNFDIFRGLISFNDLIHHPILFIGLSRGAVTGLVFGLTLTVILLFINHPIKIVKKCAQILLRMFLLALFILIVMVYTKGTPINDWFERETGGFRSLYSHQAIEGIKDRPLLGWGPGNFVLVNQKYYDPSAVDVVDKKYAPTETYSDKVHNIFFDTLINVGIVGLFSYISIFVVSLVILWRSRKIDHYIKAIFSGLILAYIIHNLVFFDILVSYMMFLLFLAIVVILDRGFEKNVQNDTYYLLDKKKAILLCLILIFTISSVKYFILLPLKEAYLNYKFYDLPIDIRGYYQDNRNFSNFGSSTDTETYTLFIVLQKYFPNMETLLKQKNYSPYIKDIDGMVKDIEENSPRGLTFFGAHISFQLSDIKYQFTHDNLLLVKMQELSEKQIEISPNDVRGYIDKARVFYLQKEYNKGIDTLESILLRDPSNPKIHAIIILFANKIGDYKLIAEKIKRAKMYIPEVEFQ